MQRTRLRKSTPQHGQIEVEMNSRKGVRIPCLALERDSKARCVANAAEHRAQQCTRALESSIPAGLAWSRTESQ
eukprot:1992763-Pyramimonas_sp.AAC.1